MKKVFIPFLLFLSILVIVLGSIMYIGNVSTLSNEVKDGINIIGKYTIIISFCIMALYSFTLVYKRK